MVEHVGDLPDRQAGRGQYLTRLSQAVVPHVGHQDRRLAGAHTRQARVPGTARAEVLLGSDGAGAARHLRVDRNRREIAEPGLAGGTAGGVDGATADEVGYRLAGGQHVDDVGGGRSCRGIGKGPVEIDAGSARTEAHREGWIEVITGGAAECHRRGDRVRRDVDGAVSYGREANEVEGVGETG